MADLHLPPEMAALRGDLGAIVAGMERRAPYAAAWLSARQGTRITVDSREERVAEQPPAGGRRPHRLRRRDAPRTALGGFDAGRHRASRA